MNDEDKSKDQLLAELQALKRDLARSGPQESWKTEDAHWRESPEGQEAFYRHIVESQTELVLRFDLEGTLTFANEASCCFFGKPRDELTGCAFWQHVAEKEREPLRAFLGSFSRESGAGAIEIHAPDSGGRLRLIQWTVRAFWDETREVSGFQAVGRAMGEDEHPGCRLAKDALRRSHQLLRDMERITEAGGWEYDVATGQATWTDEVYRIHGVSPESYDPSRIDASIAFYAGDDREVIARAFQRAVEEGERYDLELRFTDARGRSLWVRTIGQPEMLGGRVRRVYGNIQDITGRKLAEQALLESEGRFRALLECVPNVAVQGYSADGTIGYWNEASTAIYGYSSEEAVGGNVVELIIPPAMRDEARSAIRKMAETGQAEPAGELALMRKDGSLVNVFSSHAVVQIAGHAPELYCMDIDLTDQKRAEEALKKELIRRRVLFEQSRDGMVVLDQTGRAYEANQTFADMLGYPLEEVGQLHVWDWDAQWNRQELEEKIRLVDAEGEFFETVHRRKDGTTYHVEISTSGAVLDGEKHVFCACRDISRRKAAEAALEEARRELEQRVGKRTAELQSANAQLHKEIVERRRSDEALRESEHRFREIAENVQEIFWVATPESLLYINPAFERIFERSRESLYQNPHSLLQAVHPEDRDRMEANYSVNRERMGGSQEGEFRIVLANGSTRWISFRTYPVWDAGCPVRVAGFAEDITVRKEGERSTRLQLELAHALGTARSFEEALRLFLTMGLQMEGIDSGGIYLVEDTGALRLICHKGFSDGFLQRVSHYHADSAQARVASRGKALQWSSPMQLLDMKEMLEAEGIRALVSIPARAEGEVFALLNLASHTADQIQRNVLQPLETIASQIGGLLHRARLTDQLKAQSVRLQDANTALKVVLAQRDQDRAELDESICESIGSLIHPYIDKLRKTRLTEAQTLYVNMLDSNFKEITSPFTRKLSSRLLGLTPIEIRAADLIRQRKTSKEIAEVLGCSERAVLFYRQSIRRKLGLREKKINLQTYLLNLVTITGAVTHESDAHRSD
ncbi:MAG: PAS domain S-box protein [Syntrophobacteraceae bacterium]